MSKKQALSPKEAVEIYKNLKTIRVFEEKAVQLYGLGLIGGFLHVYNGQEAIVVGTFSMQKKGDTHVTAYRCHGHGIVAGMDIKAIMAELLGRETGCSKGKGGSMHMFAPDKGFMGGHGIVGSQVSLGTGFGFFHKYNETGNVCFASMGDGAADQGQVAESFNMASLWKLPVVYIIENNQYSMGTAVKRHSAGGDTYIKRGLAYNIPSVTVDGMDVLAVRDAIDVAAKHARSGKGPYLIEFETYRYRGHSMSDPGKYRSKDEVEKMKNEHDPIENFMKLGLKEGWFKEDELKAIDKEIKKQVEEASEFAQNSKEPDLSELYTDVLV